MGIAPPSVSPVKMTRSGWKPLPLWQRLPTAELQAGSLHDNAGCRSFRFWSGRLTCAKNLETAGSAWKG